MSIVGARSSSVKPAPLKPSVSLAFSPSSTTVEVSFTTPFSKLPITSYTVTSNPGGITASGASSPITVTGLTPGVPYVFTVKASHSYATSQESDNSETVTPVILSVVDVFSRTSSGSLGTSSDGKTTWTNVRGTWEADGSSATSSNTPSNRSVATVTVGGTTVTNLQVDTGTSGGVGLAFWVTDANSYYALYPSYSSSSTSSSSCSTPAVNSGQNNYSGFCANGSSFSRPLWECFGPNFGQYASCEGTNCCYGFGSGWTPGSLMGNNWYTNGTKTTVTVTTTYNSTVNLEKVESGTLTSLVSNNYSSNTSGYSKAQSIAISTSGNTISYSMYSSTNKGGSTLVSASTTPASPVKAANFGVFKGVSSADQGSTLDNFSVEVSS